MGRLIPLWTAHISAEPTQEAFKAHLGPMPSKPVTRFNWSVGKHNKPVPREEHIQIVIERVKDLPRRVQASELPALNAIHDKNIGQALTEAHMRGLHSNKPSRSTRTAEQHNRARG